MKRYTPFLIIFAVILSLTAHAAFGQDLKDNEYYQKALDFRDKAEKALESGDYDKSYEYSEEAKKNTQIASDLYAALVLKYRANKLLEQASNRIDSLDYLGVSEDDQPVLDQAKSDYDVASASFDDGDYEKSIEYSTMVLDALKDVKGKSQETVQAAPEEKPAEPTARVVETPEPPGEEVTAVPEEPAAEPKGKTLPKYYTVRLIPKRRDCFWRIAEYDFVYGDPFKWRILYEANKGDLKYPDNPDLIFPGQVFVIPEQEGEVREGTWNPEE
jgi:tetratricopeptide (TPR) repeat protein